MTASDFKSLVSSFPGTEQHPHFDRIAFKVAGKRIFATLHEKTAIANLKLTPVDQSAFCTFGKAAVFPVPNKWGLQGWTSFQLKKIPQELMADALNVAYNDTVNYGRKKK